MGGFKANYYHVVNGEEYWISGPRMDGQDALYATNKKPEVDEDAWEEYWTEIRNKPEMAKRKPVAVG